MYIELFKGKHQWYWRLKALNGQIVLTSEGYYSKWNAKRGATRLAEVNGYQVRTV